MREIKFRAWDKISNYWVQVSWGFDIDRDGVVYPCETQPKTNLVLMQYIGLKDKNGKEIYEGDILRFHIFNKAMNKTYLSRWVRIVEWKTAGSFTGFGICRPQNYEVIGNIYENPELLEA